MILWVFFKARGAQLGWWLREINRYSVFPFKDLMIYFWTNFWQEINAF
jgi:hypothetical protein